MASLYVQYGCGFSFGSDWRNFDNSPTLRIERLPLIGIYLGKLAGNSQPFPRQVEYGDICKGLPIADDSVQGVYASHVLEHLSYDDFLLALRNTFRILRPGGVFRLIVPDLQERARRYLYGVSNGSPDASKIFMETTHLGLQHKPKTILSRIRLLYGGSSHSWMWDEPSMIEHLARTGFTDVRRCEFGDSTDPMFAQVENKGRFIDAAHDLKELAIAARKP
jgi:SAM-dependent methyltransferase